MCSLFGCHHCCGFVVNRVYARRNNERIKQEASEENPEAGTPRFVKTFVKISKDDH
jgi:hypothetical protein